jgi:hypothetical protein
VPLLDAALPARFSPKLVFLKRENFANLEFADYALNRTRSVDDDLRYGLGSENYTAELVPFRARENLFGELWFNRQ